MTTHDRADRGGHDASTPPTSAKPTPRTRVSLRVQGLDCADEVGTLQRALAALVPIDDMVFDTLGGILEIPTAADTQAVITAISKTGMHASLVDEGAATSTQPWWLRQRRTVLAGVSGLGVSLGFGLHAGISGLQAAIGSEGMATAVEAIPIPAASAYLVAIAAGLVSVVPKAWYALRTLRPDMNLLMTLAVAGALGIGEWFEAATVAFLFALSLALEAWSVGRARRAVEKLLSLTPARIRIKRGEDTEQVDPNSVAVGTVFYVRPGERFALDGRLIDGSTEVDQAPITGESLPVAKEVGDEVYAGTINGNGAVEVRSTALATDTTLANVIKMVGEARKDRSDSERWVERFSAIYTPAVFAAAMAVFLLPPLLAGADWAEWFYRALVLLVIGCPCALVVSTPVAVVSGLAAAARNGVLIKGGRYLEIPAKLKVIALDKTGTLTEGRPQVIEVIAHDDHTPDSLLAAAAAIEQHSEHPIARAIVERARAQKLRIPEAEAVQTVPGKGTTGVVNGQSYWLGSHRWLEERQQETPEVHAVLAQRAGAGRTVVVMGTDDHVCGFLTLADAVRTDATAAINSLHAAGIKRVAMLTGDNRGSADAIAAELGIDAVHAELLPADKVRIVAELEEAYGPVAMIGDGVNDAPALARASIGVAMGVMGTDVAVETADVALMTDDLSKLAWLVGLSQRTVAIIRQNTVFALAVKAVFVILTFAGVASLWGAIAADMGASLLVVFNALRLLGGEGGGRRVAS